MSAKLRFVGMSVFYMIKETQSVPTTQIASDLERDYEVILNFHHDLHDLCSDLDTSVLSDVCEADEISVMAAEKGSKESVIG